MISPVGGDFFTIQAVLRGAKRSTPPTFLLCPQATAAFAIEPIQHTNGRRAEAVNALARTSNELLIAQFHRHARQLCCEQREAKPSIAPQRCKERDRQSGFCSWG